MLDAGSPRGGIVTLDLKQTEQLFFQAITWPQGTQDFLARCDAATREQFVTTFASTPGFDRVDRVDVYANAYFYRLLAALAEMFPRLAYVAGEVDFHNLVTDYVLALPSTEPDLRRLGERLPGFLGGHALGGRWPLLPELAALELSLNRALDCPGSTLVTEHDLKAVPVDRWPDLKLSLSIPSERVESRWDLESVARACHAKQREAVLASGPREARSLLVGRVGHAVYFRELGAGEARALSGFDAGLTFEAVCADVHAHTSDFEPSHMAAWLQRWLRDTVIGAVSY
jgi:hypothetical protein